MQTSLENTSDSTLVSISILLMFQISLCWKCNASETNSLQLLQTSSLLTSIILIYFQQGQILLSLIAKSEISLSDITQLQQQYVPCKEVFDSNNGRVRACESQPQTQYWYININKGTNTYYLVQLCDKRTKEIIYTWEEVSIIRSRFPIETTEMQKYLQKGKKLQKQSKWPEKRYEGLMQVRAKFWDEQEESDSEKLYDDNGKKEKIKNKIEQKKINIKRMIELQKYDSENESSNVKKVNLYLQKRKKTGELESQGSQKQKQDKQERQLNRIQKIFAQTPKSGERQRSQLEYYKILKMRATDRDLKRKRIYFTVENILGEEKQINSQTLRKTHLYEVIQYYEQYLGVKK